MRGEAAPPTVVLSGYLRKPDFKRIEQLDLTSRIGRVAHGANEKAYASARWFSLSSDGFMHYGKSEKTVNRGGKGRKGYIKVCVIVGSESRAGGGRRAMPTASTASHRLPPPATPHRMTAADLSPPPPPSPPPLQPHVALY